MKLAEIDAKAENDMAFLRSIFVKPWTGSNYESVKAVKPVETVKPIESVNKLVESVKPIETVSLSNL